MKIELGSAAALTCGRWRIVGPLPGQVKNYRLVYKSELG